jgi:2-oxoglutarate dehydrogenase E1 component
MGAWEFMRPNLEAVIAGRWPLRYVGRLRNASPAEGSSAKHALHQAALIEAAFGPRAGKKAKSHREDGRVEE